MNFGQQAPRPAQVDPGCDQVSTRVVRESGRICKSNPERVATLLAPVAVQKNVPGNAVNPCPRILLVIWQFSQAAPYDQKRVGDDVLGMIWVGAALHESNQIGVDGFIQLPEGVLPVRGTRSLAHTLYMSGTPGSVLQMI